MSAEPMPVGSHETDGPDFSYYVVCENCDHEMGWATLEQAREDKSNHEWVNPHTAKIKEGEKA